MKGDYRLRERIGEILKSRLPEATQSDLNLTADMLMAAVRDHRASIPECLPDEERRTRTP